MATIAENMLVWNERYDWSQGGNEWAANWGNASIQWHAILMPRIHALLGGSTILEIGPGFGRWTAFLKDHCQELVAVDLAPKCIAACRERFADAPHIRCFINNGHSLGMVADHSVDFIFSFDSLVHADQPTLTAYMPEIARSLRPGGRAFLHHSNLGAYTAHGDTNVIGWRATDVSADSVQSAAKQAGLSVVSQELLTWRDERCTDCFSVLCHTADLPEQAPITWTNTGFAQQRASLQAIAQLYAH
jgi:SAM-dependent methyltransferase